MGIPTDSGLIIDSVSSDRYESSLHRDSRFWEAVSARKLRSKKRKARKFLATTQEQFSIIDEHNNNYISIDDLNEIKFSTNNNNNPINLNNNNNNIMNNSNSNIISNEELILQLAAAQEDDISETSFDELHNKKTSIASSIKTNNNNNTNNNLHSELQALEDLEKELGLDDLNLFKPSIATNSNVTTNATMNSSMNASTMNEVTNNHKSDEENLDELEKYLESLNT